MAKNTFRTQPAEPKPKTDSFSKWLARVFNIEDLVKGLPSHYLNYGIWLFGLVIIYIFFSLKYENNIKEIEKLKVVIDERRSEYISKKASFMKDTKKSEIQKKVALFGLEENKEAPQKIIVEDKD
jgi:Bacteriodetes cell division protein (FtsL-like)